MKKRLLLCIILVLTLSLSACKGSRGTEFDLLEVQKSGPQYADVIGQTAPEAYATYSGVTDQLGIGGMIVAGYATGLRNSYDGHTDTQFVLTDVFYGRTLRKTITIEESYYYDPGYGYHYYTTDFFQLENDLQVLLFLDRIAIGRYRIIWRPIPLTEDYRDYNEDYLKSVLSFFRGDKSQYIADHRLAFWPEREISDEALLQEMNDHLLLRVATEYKIALWPYGHKNFTQSRHADRQFMRISIPIEEAF